MTITDRKWAFFLLLTMLSIWFSGYVQREIVTFRENSPSVLNDFAVYYTAGRIATSDGSRDLYSFRAIPDPADESKSIVVNPQLMPPRPDSNYSDFDGESKSQLQYLYPPFFSLLASPLTFISFESAQVFWHVFVYACLLFSIFLTLRLFTDDLLQIALVCIIAGILVEFSHPVRDLLFNGNIGSVILVLVMLGISLHSKHPVAGAFCIALATMIKLTPAAVVPLMLIRRQWTWLAAFAGWMTVFFAIGLWQLGWQNHYDFFVSLMPAMAEGVPVAANRSLSTAFYAIDFGKFLSQEEVRAGIFIFPPKLPGLLFRIASVGSFAALLFCFWRNRFEKHYGNTLVLEVFVVTLWTIMFSPVSFRHYYTLAICPLVFAWMHPRFRNASTSSLTMLFFATGMILSVLPSYGFALANSFPAQLAWFLVMPLGVVLLSIFLLVESKNSNTGVEVKT